MDTNNNAENTNANAHDAHTDSTEHAQPNHQSDHHEHDAHHGHTHTADKKDSRMIMGILSYLGPLVAISYIMSKDDPFVKFHIKQGLVLLAIDVIVWVVGPMFWGLWGIIRIINLCVSVLAILGILNVVQNKEKELPVVGHLAKHFTF